MPWITVISILLCISLIQTTLLFSICIFDVHPDLFLIFTIYFSLNFNPTRSFHVNWATGLAKDLFSSNLFGLNTIMFVIAGYLISIIREEIYRKHLFTQILVTFFISMIYNFISILMLFSTLQSVNFLTMIWKCPTIAVYNALIVPPVFWLLDRLYSPSRFST
ncbi:MAG: rod shape-determining protein MreD [Candidatus Scalindua sp. AMX11]|nr:MAG: rod shape-determining protein MreD [Candidatus Scalindua sp.]NOG84515.1 rod shape-determining protein MreD [Planctomycetota bacterium]RZV80477.1 MAG: rod shape-determining protein MreD [Candidatus Scalindua sp. SCAELEC01]TDE65302.1 MAG: rod shape-determining protein MreD [Candidatus Scalindua sp. AMX11]